MTRHVVTLKEDGQIEFPQPLLKKLGLTAGSRIVFDEQPGGKVMISNDFQPTQRTADIRELRGIVKVPAGFVASQDDIDAAISAGASERFARPR